MFDPVAARQLTEQAHLLNAVLQKVEALAQAAVCDRVVDVEVLSVAQAAGTLALSVSEVERMVTTGELASFKRGRRRLVPKSAIKDWIGRQLNNAKGIR